MVLCLPQWGFVSALLRLFPFQNRCNSEVRSDFVIQPRSVLGVLGFRPNKLQGQFVKCDDCMKFAECVHICPACGECILQSGCHLPCLQGMFLCYPCRGFFSLPFLPGSRAISFFHGNYNFALPARKAAGKCAYKAYRAYNSLLTTALMKEFFLCYHFSGPMLPLFGAYVTTFRGVCYHFSGLSAGPLPAAALQ